MLFTGGKNLGGFASSAVLLAGSLLSLVAHAPTANAINFLEALNFPTPSILVVSTDECMQLIGSYSNVYSNNLLQDYHCLNPSGSWGADSTLWVGSNQYANIQNSSGLHAGCQLTSTALATPGFYTIQQTVDLSQYSSEIDSQKTNFIAGVSALPILFISVATGRPRFDFSVTVNSIASNGSIINVESNSIASLEENNGTTTFNAIPYGLDPSTRQIQIVLDIDNTASTNVSQGLGFSYISVRIGNVPDSDSFDKVFNRIKSIFFAFIGINVVNAVGLLVVFILIRSPEDSPLAALTPFNAAVYYTPKIFIAAAGAFISQGYLSFLFIKNISKTATNASKPPTAILFPLLVISLTLVFAFAHFPVHLCIDRAYRFKSKLHSFLGIYTTFCLLGLAAVSNTFMVYNSVRSSVVNGIVDPFYRTDVITYVVTFIPCYLGLLTTAIWFIVRVVASMGESPVNEALVRRQLKESMAEEDTHIRENLYPKKKKLSLDDDLTGDWKSWYLSQFEYIRKAGFRMWISCLLVAGVFYLVVVIYAVQLLQKYRFQLGCFMGTVITSLETISDYLNNNGFTLTVTDAVNRVYFISNMFASCFMAGIILAAIMSIILTMQNLFGTMKSIWLFRKNLLKGDFARLPKFAWRLKSENRVTVINLMRITSFVASMLIYGGLVLFLFLCVVFLIIFFFLGAAANFPLVRTYISNYLGSFGFIGIVAAVIIGMCFNEFQYQILVKRVFGIDQLSLHAVSLYHLWFVLVLFLNLASSVVMIVRRFVFAILSQVFYSGRIDANALIKKYKFLDGNRLFIAAMLADHYYSNPYVLSFCHHLTMSLPSVRQLGGGDRHGGKDANGYGLSEMGKGSSGNFKGTRGSGPRALWARNRFFLAYTLVKNPHLCALRAHNLGKEMKMTVSFNHGFGQDQQNNYGGANSNNYYGSNSKTPASPSSQYASSTSKSSNAGASYGNPNFVPSIQVDSAPVGNNTSNVSRPVSSISTDNGAPKPGFIKPKPASPFANRQ